MMEVCEEEMKKRGMRYLLATVHPDNPYSLSNVQKRGYGIRATKEKYGRCSAIFFVRKYKHGTDSSHGFIFMRGNPLSHSFLR